MPNYHDMAIVGDNIDLTALAMAFGESNIYFMKPGRGQVEPIVTLTSNGRAKDSKKMKFLWKKMLMGTTTTL